MLWQDLVFTAGELLFLLNLLPLLRRPELGLPRAQSWTYALIFAAYGVASWTLALPLAAGTSVVSCAAWAWLGWRAPKARPRMRHPAPRVGRLRTRRSAGPPWGRAAGEPRSGGRAARSGGTPGGAGASVPRSGGRGTPRP
jgi:hypothetical protein